MAWFFPEDYHVSIVKLPDAVIDNAAEDVTLIRKTQSYANEGELTESETTSTIKATVWPAGNPRGLSAMGQWPRHKTMAHGREADGIIEFTTRFQVRSSPADVIQWHGKKYRVEQIADYSAYGFYAATAELIP